MKAGQLNHRINIYNIVLTDDGEGGFTKTETLLNTVYASVRQLSMSESTTSGQVVGENNYSVKIRRASVELYFDKTYIIEWKNKRMNITSIVSDDFFYNINATEADKLNVTTLTINNGDGLPEGEMPDILFIDTGLIVAPEFGYPDGLKTYYIAQIDGYKYISLEVYYSNEGDTITSVAYDGISTLFVVNTDNIDFGVLIKFIKSNG